MKTSLKVILIAILLVAGISSCDNSTKYRRLDPSVVERGKNAIEYDNSDSYEEPYHEEPERNTKSSTTATTTSPASGQSSAGANNTNDMVPCPGCGGTGIFRFSNDFNAPTVVCAGCNGSGKVSAALAREIIKLQQTMNQTGTSTGGGYSGGSNSGTICANCHGSGRCTYCAGRGERRYEGNYGYSGGIMECSQCHGSGTCPYCHGRGHI